MKNLRYTTALQSGRSMVEILGTLAIIGVLSIGAIAGYSYAMNKYRANTTMNDVNLRAVDLIAQVGRGGDLSLSEWPEKSTAGYDVGLESEAGKATGGIQVSGVKQDVCEILAENLLSSNITLKINGEDYVSGNCGTTNTMVFYYDNLGAFNEKKEENNKPYCLDDTYCYGTYCNSTCGRCVEGQCVYDNNCYYGCVEPEKCSEYPLAGWEFGSEDCTKGCSEHTYCAIYGQVCGSGCSDDGINCREGSCVDNCADGWTWGKVKMDNSPGSEFGCWKDGVGCIKGLSCYDINGRRVSDFREESIK